MALNIAYTPSKTVKEFMESDAKMRVLMGPVGCLGGETLVLTEYGPIPISDIDRPMRVLSWNEKTCQFQLSWCGGSYPKGEDYLYQVSTPRGGFAASGHHQIYDEHRNYQHIESVSPGLSLLLCSYTQQATNASQLQLGSLEDADRSTRTSVGFLESYAKLYRQYGQLPHAGGYSDQELSLELDDVRKSASYHDWYASSRTGDHSALLLEHNHLGQHDDQKQTGDYVVPAERLRATVEDYISKVLCAHTEASNQQFLQFQSPTCDHLRSDGPPLQCYSYITSTTEGSISSIEREEVKRVYWDLQVLDTNNYVTVDGTIHHNSGKSVACCFEVIRRAAEQAPNKDGIRKTRCAVIRETVRQLSDTTVKSWLDWFGDGVCGRFMRTTKTYYFKVGDVECEVMFRALDDADDVANLNSLELTFAWFNECRDIHPEIIDAMSKRVGRFPSGKDGGPTWHGMWCDTNPPVMDTWWYYQMEGINPEDGVSPNDNGWKVFKQPSGRSIYAENIENLPEGYYDTQGRSDDYIRVFIDGLYGISLNGTPVYKFFQPDYHVSKSPLVPIINGVRPILVALDLGLTPAAVIGQQDPRGRMIVLAEAAAFDMGIQRFSRTVLKPLINERFPGQPIMVVVDPAGVQRAQTDERSAVDILKGEGFRVIPARTNNISARLNAVDDFLMRQVDGDAAFLLDPRCTRLKAAMMGGYRYHEKNGTILKNQHSHIAEALQYLALHIASVGDNSAINNRREVRAVRAQGWT